MLLTSLIPMKYPKGASPFWTKMDPSLQNLLHIPMFTIFVFICSQTCKDVSWCKDRMLWVISGTAIFLSVVMESLQIVVPGRYPSSTDILLNIFGSAMGCLFLVYNQKRT
jgi:VanZ family protein